MSTTHILTTNSGRWLPDFSATMRVFTVIVVAQMMVVIYSLSFLGFDYNYLNRLALLSLLAQLIAVTVIVLLHWLRDFFNRFSVGIGVSLVLVMTILMAVFYTQLLAWLDQALQFDLVSDPMLTTLKISTATGVTLLALMRYFYVQNQWSKQVTALANAQMNELQARIKPHFLYNSMNSIASLIPIDPNAAEQAVLNLSGLFRKAFADHEDAMTTLDKELAWVKEYLAIEKLRLMDRLQVEIEVDEGLQDESIPLLSIQPLVENAVVHGIQNLPDGGAVRLKVWFDEHGLSVKVSNPYRAGHDKAGHGVGLANIEQRLLLAYGERAELTVQSGDEFVAQWRVPK